MKTLKRFMRASLCGLLVSGLGGAVLPMSAQQPANPEKISQVATLSTEEKSTLSAEQAVVDALPDSPGATVSNSVEPTQRRMHEAQNDEPQSIESSGPLLAQNQSSSSQSNSTQSNPNAAPDGQKPVGTAAAEAPHATGIAASQPAGVAIAPAKQHRVRTIVIRVGAIVGAGVAVGTVVGLTEATSSKPPGAH